MNIRLSKKDRIKVLFVRPPCHLWPILNESDNFVMPLNFPALAAYLRREMQDVELKILDCLPLKIGWKSLERVIADERPDVLLVGDMIVYMHEGMRLCRMAKELDPEVVTIAGGTFHSHLPQYTMEHHPELDLIVRYEGEETLRELLETLRAGGDLHQVKGVVFREEDRMVQTPARPLIEDLDSLPIPAYDLVPVDKYSPFGLLWPKAATVQSNRGCPYMCDFCSWSAQEGAHELQPDGTMRLIPQIRLKSPGRVMEELELLYEKHHSRYLFWTDGTWNFDTAWLDELSSEIIRRDYDLGWWAFVRADLMLAQEEAGVLEKMVRAGLRHTLFGAERSNLAQMNEMGKDLEPDDFVRCSHMLERKYPQVFRQATFVTGIRSDSHETLRQLSEYTRKTHVDFAAIHPLMPYPGTALWDRAVENDWIQEKDFSRYDMFYPIMATEHLTRAEVAEASKRISLDFVGKQPWRYFKALFSRFKIRRKLHWWFLFSIGRVVMHDLWLAIRGKKKFEGYAAVNRLWKPSWYDD
jgi:anaerobic magnesium-protoporphyrin IX monomethyl ester cyclase